ncbi:tRNA(Ile)-lysidine synthetase [Secundilactobacillus silagincola]|uniref:tRNA(Ile)-lysidine synthase n=1 Tax=Secundilactobacillus silagincola TaxID=1714681 RepID=A0A1Z5J433_9LACO|nr:tRNA lysidine(34) synthetase TilS [Secundilactobacillus silagincola]GAX08850.1 tRNA(Ile)-lysidine synthetase [Secundilactobacillus silagincola]
MDIVKQFKSIVIQANWFDSNQTVIVAVSAGVDSMVLLTLMQQLPVNVRPKLVVAHVNHQLRQQSEIEEQFMMDYCHQRHIQLEIAQWPVANHPQTGVEAAARRFRYDFFAELMQRHHASCLLTAHHADDQAETVLMKLVRGGQLMQLRGILPEQPFETGKLIRPLLAFSKAQIKNYAEQSHLTWYEDETNQVDDVFRNRVRHQLIPLLKQENPAFLEHVQAYTSQLTATIQLADERTQELLQEVRGDLDDGTYSVMRWRKLALIHQQAVLKAVFKLADLPITTSYVEEATQLLNNDEKPNGEVNLAHSQVFEKAYDHFSIKSVLKVPQNHKPADKIVVISNQWVQLSRGLQARLEPARTTEHLKKCHMTLELKPNELPLSIRQALPDDRINLIGGGHKTVRRILIDHKVPRSKRSQQLVVVTATGEVLWLIGVQRSTRDLTEPNYELVLKQSD